MSRDAFVRVFEYLDASSLVAAEIVCKDWRTIIKEHVPSFWQQQCRSRWRWWKTAGPVGIPVDGGAGAGAGAAASADPRGRRHTTSAMDTTADAITTDFIDVARYNAFLAPHNGSPCPVGSGFSEAKLSYGQRHVQDSEIRRVFPLVAHPATDVAAMKYVAQVGTVARDELALLGRSDLTSEFYARQITRIIHERAVASRLRALGASDAPTCPEDGLLLITQWSNPGLDMANVLAQMNGLVGDVREALQAAGLIHIDEDSGAVVHDSGGRLAAIRVLNTVLFDDFGLKGNTADFYDPRNSLLDQVLGRKLGIPISIAIVYAFLARHVGIPLKLIGMPAKFVLQYVPEPGCTDATVFIDVFERGALLSVTDIQAMLGTVVPDPTNPAYLAPVSHKELWSRCLRNLVNSYKRLTQFDELVGATSLYLALFPTAGDMLEQRMVQFQTALFTVPPRQDVCLAAEPVFKQLVTLQGLSPRVKAMLQTFLAQVDTIKENTAKQLILLTEVMRNPSGPPLPYPKPPKPRTGAAAVVRFRVGQCIRHRNHGYRGVIVGWDPTCEASEDWKSTMQIHLLPRQANQPFYKVIIDVRDRRRNQAYVAEDNITVPPDLTEPIQAAVGIHFDRLVAGPPLTYHPNAALAAEFPEDWVEAGGAAVAAVEVGAAAVAEAGSGSGSGAGGGGGGGGGGASAALPAPASSAAAPPPPPPGV